MRHSQLQKYLPLPQNGKIIAEYVWIDGSNGLRSKCKVSDFQLRSFFPHHAAAFATRAAVWKHTIQPQAPRYTSGRQRSNWRSRVVVVSCDLMAHRSIVASLHLPLRPYRDKPVAQPTPHLPPIHSSRKTTC
jgi:hypothetical protein